jgi:hypothetical protein
MPPRSERAKLEDEAKAIEATKVPSHVPQRAGRTVWEIMEHDNLWFARHRGLRKSFTPPTVVVVEGRLPVDIGQIDFELQPDLRYT